MNSTILAVPMTQECPRITDEAVNREALGPIARRLANNSLGAWLESHLQQYTDAVRALGDRDATPRYLR